MTRVTRLIHNAGKYLLISIYPLPTHPTHNFTHKNGGNLDTLPDWPKKFNHNRPARCAGQSHFNEGSWAKVYFPWIWRYSRQRFLREIEFQPEIQWDCQFYSEGADMPALEFPESSQTHLHRSQLVPWGDARGCGELLSHTRWQWLAMVFYYVTRGSVAGVQHRYEAM